MSDQSDFSSDFWRCRWICPPPKPLSREQHRRFLQTLAAISLVNDENFRALDSVGLEIKLSLMVAGNEEDLTAGGDNDYWQRKCRVMFLRPAIEPIAISYWERLISLDLDIERAKKLTSALTVKEQGIRIREGVGRSMNGNVGFELPEQAHAWLDRLKAGYGRPELASFMPMYCFAATIMAHPFWDGNGRLARILTLGALARLASWKHPMVGLAPSFYRHAETLGKSLDELTLTGNWTRYVNVFLDIVDDAHQLMKLLNQA